MSTPRPTHCPHCGERIAADPKRRVWSPDEDARLREMLQAARDHQDIAEALGRPVSSIRSRIDTLAKNKAMPARTARTRRDIDTISDKAESRPSSITVLPGVRIITHRMRG